MKKTIVLYLCIFLLTWVSVSSALTIDFDGGTATLATGDTLTTDNSHLDSNIASYVEQGVMVEFVGLASYDWGPMIGDFYGVNEAVLFAVFGDKHLRSIRFSMVDGAKFNLNSMDVTSNFLFHGVSESWVTAPNGVTEKIPYLRMFDKTERMWFTEEFNNITYFTITSTLAYFGVDKLDISLLQADPDAADTDEDGIIDNADNCLTDSNPEQYDSDADGIGDVCDPCSNDPDDDIDADGVCGDVDNCPGVANDNQFDFDEDGLGNQCDTDDDNDDWLDEHDNCQFDFNPDQLDLDRDGTGNVCDSDVDGDNVVDGGDECLATALGDTVNSAGCSIAQICPCDNNWKNHGGYVKCLAHISVNFVNDWLISLEEKGVVVSTGARSTCGK